MTEKLALEDLLRELTTLAVSWSGHHEWNETDDEAYGAQVDGENSAYQACGGQLHALLSKFVPDTEAEVEIPGIAWELARRAAASHGGSRQFEAKLERALKAAAPIIVAHQLLQLISALEGMRGLREYTGDPAERGFRDSISHLNDYRRYLLGELD